MNTPKITIRWLTVIAAGTTGMQLENAVKQRVAGEFDDTLYPQLAFVNIETEATLPDDVPGTNYVPIGADYSGHTAEDFPDAASWKAIMPPEAFASLVYGASKLPIAGKVGVEASKNRIARALDTVRPRGTEYFHAKRELMARHPDLQLSEQPLFVIAGAAGGSTAPAIILNQVDAALQAPKSPLVCVFLIGPRAGASFDNYQTEDKNALHLLAALQTRRAANARLWVFLLDGALHEREAVMQSAGNLAVRLAVTRPGELDLTRILLDGFAVSARNHGAPTICRVNAAALSADSTKARARALDQLIASLGA